MGATREEECRKENEGGDGGDMMGFRSKLLNQQQVHHEECNEVKRNRQQS